MADSDRDLQAQARKLMTMFKNPGMVTPKMTEELLRWIIDRASTTDSATQQQDTCDS